VLESQRRGAWRRLLGAAMAEGAATRCLPGRSEAADGQWAGGRRPTASGRAGDCHDAPGDWDRHAAGMKIFAAGSGWGSARRGGGGGCGGRAGANTYPVKDSDCSSAGRPRDGCRGRRTVLRETAEGHECGAAEGRCGCGYGCGGLSVCRERGAGLPPSPGDGLLLERRRGKLADAD
jgi:hypothetical protein